MYGIVCNPVSGGGRGKQKAAIVLEKLQEKNIPFEILYTQCAGHGKDCAQALMQKGYRKMIVIGGDGTHNEVAQAVCEQSDEVRGQVNVAMMAGGTGNDFCRGLGLPLDMIKAVDMVLAGKTRKVDIVAVNENRFFINVLGLGIDVALMEKAERLKKRFSGMTVYILALLITLLGFKNKTVRVITDGVERKHEVLMLTLSIGPYCGGGMRVAPHAKMDDGLMDVCIIDKVFKGRIPFVLPRFIKGTHLAMKEAHALQCKEVTIKTPEPVDVEIDGDIALKTPLHCRVLEKAISVYVP